MRPKQTQTISALLSALSVLAGCAADPAPAPAAPDPCAGVELPACPAPCPASIGVMSGDQCFQDGARCGNQIGDGCSCRLGTWSCQVHAPLGPGCNLVCR